MAFNGMKVIHSGLGARLQYIMNPAKTENGLLTAGSNTTPQSALADIMDTKQRFGKIDKRQGYHIIQSFAPGEIELERALQFGLEFIEKYLGGHFESVAAVHTDKAHIHVHIIFNSVSCIDGKKYHAAHGEYLERIREMCDEQCRAWGLSVIEGDFKKCKTTKDEYRQHKNGKPSCRDQIRADIDRAIRESCHWESFVVAMKKQGYAVKETRSGVSLRAPGMLRFIRLRTLGEGYSKKDLTLRAYDSFMLPNAMVPGDVPLPASGAAVTMLAQYYAVRQQMRSLLDKYHGFTSFAARRKRPVTRTDAFRVVIRFFYWSGIFKRLAIRSRLL